MSEVKGFLGWLERAGNRLPDPVFIFLYLIIGLVIISAVFAALGVSAVHPTQLNTNGTAATVDAVSLLSAHNIQRLLVKMPETYTHFYPLGYVLLVMLGAGVAERSGFLESIMRAAVRHVPNIALTPFVALIGMLTSHAADAGYVVFIPLAATLYAAAGRHPIAGIVTAFAGVAGGFSANISPGQLDALLLGIAQEAVDASNLDAAYTINIAGNTFLIQAMTLLFVPVIWFVTDKIVEPRLGVYQPGNDSPEPGNDSPESGNDSPEPGNDSPEPGNDSPASDQRAGGTLTPDQAKGLIRALFVALGVVALWALLTLGPGTVLIDESACSSAATDNCSIHLQLKPFYQSLIAAFFVLFLACGWAYGAAAKTIKGHRDVVRMMTDSMQSLAYYIVLVFVAAHFVAMFGWSNLGLIFAINGAEGINSANLPLPLVMALVVVGAATLNLFIGSASAKWAMLAPILVPMLMLLGVSPEGATAAYRLGDSATNISTPLDIYFPLVLIFAQRWQQSFGVGSLLSAMIPYSVAMLIAGVAMIVGWIAFGLPLGPDASIDYALPGSVFENPER